MNNHDPRDTQDLVGMTAVRTEIGTNACGSGDSGVQRIRQPIVLGQG